MSIWPRWFGIAIVASLMATPFPARGADKSPAERGKEALETRSFTPSTFTTPSYDKLWEYWGIKAKPAPYVAAVMERYGLHSTPFPNKDLPMGLREGTLPLLLGGGKGISTDCMLCHGGSINGKSYVGLGNSALDFESLMEDWMAAMNLPRKLPFKYTNVRGTIEAGAFSVFLMARRNPDLSIRFQPLDLDLKDDLCEDTPAWWLLKKKKTMYYTGGGHAESVRSLMQFMMSPLNGPDAIKKEEATFRDIQSYILSIEAPKYPWAINTSLAAKGEPLFRENCARCHGTYGAKATYPNKVIPLKEIGTDPKRFYGISESFGKHYNGSWFAEENAGWFTADFKAIPSEGYQAPPLDGIWATAPYFHNGSTPTVYHVLNSKARPKVFTRFYRTDKDAYDLDKLGWKVQVMDKEPDEKASPFERRKIYDTTRPGRSNGGHTFGDDLDDAERLAIIEYLKTL